MPPTSVPHAPHLRPQQWPGRVRELSRSASATALVPGLRRALSEQPAQTSGIRVAESWRESRLSCGCPSLFMSTCPASLSPWVVLAGAVRSRLMVTAKVRGGCPLSSLRLRKQEGLWVLVLPEQAIHVTCQGPILPGTLSPSHVSLPPPGSAGC